MKLSLVKHVLWLLPSCLGLLWCLPAQAEVVKLAELERTALVGNQHALDIDLARARGTDANVSLAASAYRPQVWLRAASTVVPGVQLVKVDEGKETYLVQGSQELGESGAFNANLRNTAQIDAAAKIYDFGRTSAAVEAGRREHASAIAQADVTRTAIVKNVRAAYLGWLSASELSGFAGQAAQESLKRRERVEGLIREGARPGSELTPARADELLTRVELERAQGELASAVFALESAVGSALPADATPDLKIGRASCRERVLQVV